jgi:hypothetical protein
VHYFGAQVYNGCESNSRLDVTVLFQQGPPKPTGNSAQGFCNGATLTQLTVSGSAIQWYDSPTGGILLTPSTILIDGQHYYASQTIGQCESVERLDVTANIQTIAAPSLLAPVDFCSIEQAKVSSIQVNGTNVKWYGAISGGLSLLTSTVLVNGSHYYASQTIGGCESTSRLDVTAQIRTTAAPSLLSPADFCSAEQAKISSIQVNGANVKWYSASSGGSLLSASTALVNGFHYYASQTISGCESTTRLDVTAQIRTTVAPGLLSPADFCSTVQAKISFIQVVGTNIQWYNASSGGTPLPTSTALVNGSHYFASQTINGCESTLRLDVVAQIRTTAAPNLLSPVDFCSTEQANISSIQVNGINVKWYSASSGGPSLSTSTALVNGTHYYASQTISGCESNTRLDVMAQIRTTAPPVLLLPAEFCANENPTLQSIQLSGVAIKWYQQPTGGVELPQTTVLVNNQSYYATQTIGNCQSEARLVVTAIVHPNPPAPTGDALQSMQPGSTIANIVVTGNQITWYGLAADALAGINSIASSQPLIDGHTYYATQTLAGCASSPMEVMIVMVVTGIEPYFENLIVYPNPVNNTLTISLDKVMSQVSVINGSKINVINRSLNDKQTELDFSKLDAGIYFILIKSANKTMSYKVIKK